MAEKSNRTPIDNEAEDALHRLLEVTQNLQRRIFRSTARGFLTGFAVAEMQYDAASVAREIGELSKKVGVGPLDDRR